MLRAVFVAHFAGCLNNLQGAEQTTKRELLSLSRDLLTAIHGFKDEHLGGDIQFINQTLAVLTPVNRKVAVLFFKHFSGFHYDDVLKSFSKKSAKRYADAKKDSEAFLADPNQNIWTWAEREIHVEQKPLDVKKITSYMEGVMKKAAGQNITRGQVLRAVFDAGFTAAEITALMETVVKEAEERKALAEANQAPM
jgi:hypothetical protein